MILNKKEKRKKETKDLSNITKLKNIYIIIFILFLSACGVKNNNFQNTKKAEIKINNKIITAEVVQSVEAQARGLSGRKNLEKNEGMIFVYSNKKKPTFWMKDMLFPIDIIWICDDKIVDLSENLPIPENGKIKRVTPKDPINYVLEVNASFVKENNLKIGDKIEIILNK